MKENRNHVKTNFAERNAAELEEKYIPVTHYDDIRKHDILCRCSYCKLRDNWRLSVVDISRNAYFRMQCLLRGKKSELLSAKMTISAQPVRGQTVIILCSKEELIMTTFRIRLFYQFAIYSGIENEFRKFSDEMPFEEYDEILGWMPFCDYYEIRRKEYENSNT